jgi:abortive infection bacteriophage resistance protein
MDAVERIEVAFRTCLSNYMCDKYGPHWFMDKRLYRGGKFFAKFIQIVAEKSGCKIDGHLTPKREPEPFLASYFAKYDDPKLPPSWMITEVLSISDWSLVYEELEKREDRKMIAANFSLSAEILESWIHAVAYVRNLCAHHSRLWNREFTIKPRVAEKFREQLTPNNRYYAQAFVLNQLMLVISPDTTWSRRLLELLNKTYEKINKLPMGFPANWNEAVEWRVR